MSVSLRGLLGIGAWVVVLCVALCPAYTVLAAHCTVSGIAIIAGQWESMSGQTSYTVQAQDSSGTECHVGETLRLSFESFGGGTFIGQTGSAVQKWIATGSANRNFYYQHAAGATDVITIKAGYGTADSWSVSWEDSHDTAEAPVSGGDDDSGTADAESASGGSGTIVHVESESDERGGTLAVPRIFADDPLTVTVSHQKSASVGQPVQFAAIPDGLEDAQLRTVRYGWSFGDGSTSTERTPTHTYKYPGTYVVVGIARRQGHEIVVRSELAVVPLNVSLHTDPAGNLLIRNNASHESEISGLVVSDGTASFTIPEYTHLLAGASLVLSGGMTGFRTPPATAMVHGRTGGLLAYYPPIASYVVDTGEAAFAGTGTGGAVSVSAPLISVSAAPRAVSESAPVSSAMPLVPVDEIGDSSITAVGGANNHAYTWQSATAQSAAPQARLTAPFAFVGVMLVGILALYVHKVV